MLLERSHHREVAGDLVEKGATSLRFARRPSESGVIVPIRKRIGNNGTVLLLHFGEECKHRLSNRLNLVTSRSVVRYKRSEMRFEVIDTRVLML